MEPSNSQLADLIAFAVLLAGATIVKAVGGNFLDYGLLASAAMAFFFSALSVDVIVPLEQSASYALMIAFAVFAAALFVVQIGTVIAGAFK